MSAKSYTKQIRYLILITAIVKMSIAPLLELGNDEVYYWTYALQLDWNHFDHPPMIGLLIRLTSFNLLWANEFSLRLGSIIAASISTWFVFKIAALLSNERTGWFTALIYTASIYTGFIAGFFILPDSPQMPFYTASLYVMTQILFSKNDLPKTKYWLLLGALIGIALLCKVHALFLWAGFGLFILLKKRSELLNWRLYLSAGISFLGTLPIFYWNWTNNFITYKFHSNRVTHGGIKLDSFLNEILGEFAYQNPIIFILLLIAIISLLKKKIIFSLKNASVWLFCMSIPMLLVFWSISLFNSTLPHWTGPAFIPLFIIGGLYLDKKSGTDFPIWNKASIFLVAIVLILGILLIRLSPINFGSKDKANYGEYCPTLDMSGWNELGKSFALIVKKDIAENKIRANAVLLANNWFPAGHLEFYVSPIAQMPLIGIGLLADLHKFAWLNQKRPYLKIGSDAYCIVPSNLPINVKEVYGVYFKEIQAPIILPQIRCGGTVRYFYIYRLKGCINIPKAIL